MICLINKNNPVRVSYSDRVIYFYLLTTIFWRSRRPRRCRLQNLLRRRSRRPRRAGRLIKSAFG